MGAINMPLPKALVTRYFQLILNRKFTESERELERLNQKMHKTEWNRGYYRALNGMYLSRKTSSDTYSFFSNLNFTDRAALLKYRREFLEHTRNGLHADFDRGYFSAWADCMRVLARLAIPSSKENERSEKLATVSTDKSQATIENYVGKEHSRKKSNRPD